MLKPDDICLMEMNLAEFIEVSYQSDKKAQALFLHFIAYSFPDHPVK